MNIIIKVKSVCLVSSSKVLFQASIKSSAKNPQVTGLKGLHYVQLCATKPKRNTFALIK